MKNSKRPAFLNGQKFFTTIRPRLTHCLLKIIRISFRVDLQKKKKKSLINQETNHFLFLLAYSRTRKGINLIFTILDLRLYKEATKRGKGRG